MLYVIVNKLISENLKKNLLIFERFSLKISCLYGTVSLKNSLHSEPIVNSVRIEHQTISSIDWTYDVK